MTGGEARPWRRAILWMVGCSLLFSAVYNLSNWITTLRTDVGVWAFEWEFGLPFVPWTILPYWTLDLFFVGSFFLCASRRELTVHGKRIVLAILIAAACYLFLPLRNVFPRPAVDGFSGMLFAALRSFDQPHNLFPSLHITFCSLFADRYSRHAGSWLRPVVHAWFGLIVLSTLLTYQHHVMDLVGGYLLAVVCFHAYRESDTMAPAARNSAVASRYALGTALLVVTAGLARPWGSLLLWPAAGLGWVAAGYFGLGAGVYRKENGRLPLSSVILFCPVLLGHWVSAAYYRRRSDPWNEVAPGILVGRRLSNREALVAVRQGVTAVLDLTAESSEAPPFLALTYKNLPVLDLTAPTQGQMSDAVAFLQAQQELGKVYVHCKAGFSRSAAIAAAYRLARGLAEAPSNALQDLEQARPSIVIRPEIVNALEAFHARTAG